MTKSLDNVVVVGGGSSGWMTALLVKSRLPLSNVTVIESNELGILGAGEGTTPMFVSFLTYIDLPISTLISKCNATFKNALKFTNWNGDNEYFYHNFSPAMSQANSLTSFHNQRNFGKYNTIYGVAALKNMSLNKLDFVSFLNESNKVGQFEPSPNLINQWDQYQKVSLYGVHFDAVLLAKTLKEIGIERGISVVEGKVINIVSNELGDITSLNLDSNKEINLDFVFDCSGFHKLLIGNHFKSQWVSLSDTLSCDSALPFFIPMSKEIPPYTECIAMKYGWVWKIPLQNRFGCGYVFDSSFISEEDAAKEIEEYLGYTPEYPRKNKGSFKFNAGYFSKTWVNNCIAVGLSSSFVEPLEATSIGVTLLNLATALSNPWVLANGSETDRAIYNAQFTKLMDEIGSFIYMHYMTKRTDTDFWMQFKDKNLAPKRLKDLLTISENRVLEIFDIDREWDAFNYGSFMEVGLGIKLINTDRLKEMTLFNDFSGKTQQDYPIFINQLEKIANDCITHNNLLKNLGGLK
jgi:tryptophan halogenase